MFTIWNKVYAVLSENIACCNLRVSWVKKIILKSYPCKVCDKLHVCFQAMALIFQKFWNYNSVLYNKFNLTFLEFLFISEIAIFLFTFILLTNHFLYKHRTHDRWHTTRDRWHMTHDTWHMTHNTWYVVNIV